MQPISGTTCPRAQHTFSCNRVLINMPHVAKVYAMNVNLLPKSGFVYAYVYMYQFLLISSAKTLFHLAIFSCLLLSRMKLLK